MQLIFQSCQILKCWNWAFIIPISSAAHLFATPCLQILFSDGLTKMAARVRPSSTLCMMGVWKEAHLPNDWTRSRELGFNLNQPTAITTQTQREASILSNRQFLPHAQHQGLIFPSFPHAQPNMFTACPSIMKPLLGFNVFPNPFSVRVRVHGRAAVSLFSMFFWLPFFYKGARHCL